MLLNYLMDPRTGLGRFRDFRVSNYQLMMDLIDSCLDEAIDEILACRTCKERVDLYREHAADGEGADAGGARRCTGTWSSSTCARRRQSAPTNRFMIYALYPAVQHLDPRAVGAQAAEHRVRHRQVDRRPLESRTNIGALMLDYGGGGHEAAGTCQVANDRGRCACWRS